MIFGCKIHDNTGHGTFLGASPVVGFNSYYGNGDGATPYANIRGTSSVGMRIFNNSIDGDGQSGLIGIHQDETNAPYGVYINNILFDLGVGIQDDVANAQEMTISDHNFFYSNDTDRINIDTGGNDVAGSADPFTDSAGRDYTLNAVAGGGAACKNAGVDAGSFLDIGALQTECTGSSGGLLMANKRGNKQ